MTATEWVVVNGHILGQCAYLRSLDKPWEPEEPCDCRDHDAFWGERGTDEGKDFWDEDEELRS